MSMMKKLLPLFYIVIIGLVLLFTALSQPEPEIIQARDTAAIDFGMSFPENYRDDYVLYLIVDRPDRTVRHVYAAPQVIEAVEVDEAIPYDSQIVIETFDAQTDFVGNAQRDRQGHFIAGAMRPNVHVMEKRDDWTIEQLPSPVGVIEWNFGSFDANTMLPSTENRNDCMTCHDSGAFRRDFVFSRRFIEQYVADGYEVQYLYCGLTGRANCIR